MNLSDLQAKEIISVNSGKKMGKIIDVNVDNESGKINYLVAEQRKFFRRIFGGNVEFKFTFDDIEKIGTDVILLKL